MGLAKYVHMHGLQYIIRESVDYLCESCKLIFPDYYSLLNVGSNNCNIYFFHDSSNKMFSMTHLFHDSSYEYFWGQENGE